MVVARRRGSCRIRGSAEWILFKVSTLLMMSDYDEDLDDFQPSQQKTQTDQPNLCLDHIAQNQQINGQLQVESLQKFHHFFDGPTSWFKYEELVDDWLDLTVLETGKRGSALKNILLKDAEMHEGLLYRESLRAEDGVMYFRDTLRSISSKELRVFCSGDLSIYPSKERKHRDRQVDWQVLTALEAIKRCLDGHVADIRHERNPKTKPESCWRESRKWR